MPGTPASSLTAAKDAAPNVAGDIPDSQVYVPYTTADGTFTVTVPQGWARVESPGFVEFSDHYNSVHIASHAAASAPSVDSVKSTALAHLQGNTAGYVPGSVTTVTRKAGPAVLATYRATSAPDPATGKTVPLEVQRYAFFHAGRTVVLTLSAPVGSDNVDPWNTITNSLRWNS